MLEFALAKECNKSKAFLQKLLQDETAIDSVYTVFEHSHAFGEVAHILFQTSRVLLSKLST